MALARVFCPLGHGVLTFRAGLHKVGAWTVRTVANCTKFDKLSNMAAIKALNPKAEVARSAAALHLNITAARGLQDVLKTNLGPKGTMKMWVKSSLAFQKSVLNTCLSIPAQAAAVPQIVKSLNCLKTIASEETSFCIFIHLFTLIIVFFPRYSYLPSSVSRTETHKWSRSSV